MPNVRADHVVGIFLSDCHFSLKAPLFRQAETDWLEAQARPWREIAILQEQYGCPVVIAGDLFDKPENSAELVNFVLDVLPYKCYAVPGQHDLLYHRYEDIRRTSYWTLVKAGRIVNLDYRQQPCGEAAGQLVLWGFPWKAPLVQKPVSDAAHIYLDVAVVHRYVWATGHGYVGASEEDVAGHILHRDLRDYDAIASGDNHSHFTTSRLFNCGTLMRRKLDEKDYWPRIGLLGSDGSWRDHRLSKAQDKISEERTVKKEIAKETDRAQKFLAELKKAKLSSFDFRAAVIKWMAIQNISDETRGIVLTCLK